MNKKTEFFISDLFNEIVERDIINLLTKFQ